MGAGPRLDDEGTVDGGSEGGDVGVPPEGALLAGDGELVGVAVSGHDRALRYHIRPVGPAGEQLEDPMPAYAFISVI